MPTALFLFKVLKPVHKNYAALMVICTLFVAPISMLNELNQVAILLLVMSEYTWLGEVLMVLWLLIKGGKVEQWEKHALESAGK